jgi:hypothetical protein
MTSTPHDHRGFSALAVQISTVVVLLVAADSRAQTTSPGEQIGTDRRGTVVLQATGAAAQIYLDEAYPDHWEFGGSIRLFLSPQLAVESELLKFQSNVDYLPNEHSYIWGAGLLGFLGSSERRSRPYWTGGLSVRAGGQANTATWPYGGFGLQLLSDRHLSVSVEARAPIFWVGLHVGYRFAPRRPK